MVPLAQALHQLRLTAALSRGAKSSLRRRLQRVLGRYIRIRPAQRAVGHCERQYMRRSFRLEAHGDRADVEQRKFESPDFSDSNVDQRICANLADTGFDLRHRYFEFE